jgi:protein-tyrosine phosphatase
VTRVCFVCWGNICRSPIAEGVLRGLVDIAGLGHQITVDSAGTSSEHLGQRPDRRAIRAAAGHGIDLDGHRAWRFESDDFDRFDLVVAMDRVNLDRLRPRARTPEDKDKLVLLRAFDPDAAPSGDPYALDVPDPYHGGADEFAQVYDLCDRACRGLLAHLRDGA